MIWRAENKGDIFSECAKPGTPEIKGLTTLHPLEYAIANICHGYNPTCDGSDYILVRYDPQGEYPPYLGSKSPATPPR